MGTLNLFSIISYVELELSQSHQYMGYTVFPLIVAARLFGTSKRIMYPTNIRLIIDMNDIIYHLDLAFAPFSSVILTKIWLVLKKRVTNFGKFSNIF